MTSFLKLTLHLDGADVYVNASAIVMLRRLGDKTFVSFTGDDYTEVKETPEQLLAMIAATAPAMPWPYSLPRTWEQTPQTVPTGPWCLSPGSRYEYERPGDDPFNAIADFLWPHGKAAKQQQELLDGPPDM